MKITALYPGQGSQFSGMGEDLCGAFAAARNVYDTVSQAVEQDVLELSRSDAETLAKTQVAQLAIFTHSMAVTEILRAEGVEIEAAAGFSLGELSAFCAAGIYTVAQGAEIVKLRGTVMGQQADADDGVMVAIVGLAADEVELCCIKAGGDVSAVNYNSPVQTVIAGSREDCQKAADLCLEAGASRAVPLAVSGAFHTDHMEVASQQLHAYLNEVSFADPTIPVYINETGFPLDEDDIAGHLARQMISPVRWVKTVQNMVQNGYTAACECGPGKVLAGNGRRITRDMKVKPMGTVTDMEKLLAEK